MDLNTSSKDASPSTSPSSTSPSTRSSHCKCSELVCKCLPWDKIVEHITLSTNATLEKKNARAQAKQRKYKKSQALSASRDVWPAPDPAPGKKRKRKNKFQELNDKLAAVGFPLPEYGGRCARAGIANGNIKFEGEADLDQVLVSGKGMECGHGVTATLRDVMDQTDYGGDEYTENAVVFCDEIKEAKGDTEACEYGKFFVAGLCSGKPRLDWGRGHHHCNQCPGFGRCIGDFRDSHCEDCGNHYFVGRYDGGDCEKCAIKKPSRYRVHEESWMMARLAGCRDTVPPFEVHSDSEDEYFREQQYYM